MRKLIAILLLCSGITFVMWAWQEPKAGCEYALPYRIGVVDAGFKLGPVAFREAVEQAVYLWENATGQDLFTYDPTASFTINLIFDDRQRDTIAGQNLSRQLKQTEASHHNVRAHWERWQAIYDAQQQDYEQALATFRERLEAYNAEVETLTQQGDIPRERYEALQAESDDLDQEKAELETMYQQLEEVRAQLESLKTQNTSLVTAYNQSARTYNTLHSVKTPFHKGEFNGNHITIYQYQDKADLTLVLAHELGHALGIDHVNVPEAIMYPLMGAQDLDQLKLTPVDVETFRKVCGHQA